MKLLTGILCLKLYVYGGQSTEVPSWIDTTTFSTQFGTDISGPTSPMTTPITSTMMTYPTTTQENSDSINRAFNTWYRPNYNPWPPVPIFIPTTPAPQRLAQPIRRNSNYCGQTWFSQNYHVSDHDDQGKCKNCNNINRAKMEIVDPNISRVVNGRNAAAGEVPWNIEIYSYHNYFKGCGATLISANKILSAAHCFHTELRRSPKRRTDYIEATYHNSQRIIFKYKAVAGLKYQNFWLNSPDMQTRDIEKIAIPRQYRGHIQKKDKRFDIAVLVLREPFWINEYVTPACLPTSRLQIQNGLGVISGLGLTDPSRKDLSAERLQRAEIEIIPGSQCRNKLRKIGPYRKLFNGVHMLCGYGKRRRGSRTDACEGDSGGPLVVKINNAYTVIGVTSWGDGPGVKSCGGIGVYAKVSKYINFINLIN